MSLTIQILVNAIEYGVYVKRIPHTLTYGTLFGTKYRVYIINRYIVYPFILKDIFNKYKHIYV